MVSEFGSIGMGWAQFSADKSKRYRLARALTETGYEWLHHRNGFPIIVVFVMLNPSTADAFKLDPTVTRCRKFAELWGADVLQVVNLFAYRSPYPEDLYVLAKAAEDTGADAANNDAIVAACTEWPSLVADRKVIAAWGRHGKLAGRGDFVRELLSHEGVKLHTLGHTEDGSPIHPLARGRHFVPYDREPQPWR